MEAIALDPRLINRVRKPKQPGGHRDSGADVAYVLKNHCGIDIITPTASPDPLSDEEWCFPDDEEGIGDAVRRGATYIWANIVLFAQHPLQMSSSLAAKEQDLRVVGQPPRFVELFDDKNLVNELLRSQSGFTLPKAVTITNLTSLKEATSTARLPFPVVAKPVRGRGRHGVRVCRTGDELEKHVCSLIAESPSIILEEYLTGQEVTVTVMPPSQSYYDHWAMPIIARFNHANGIAPYNGVVAVIQNSRAVSQHEHDNDLSFVKVVKQCVAAAKLL